MPSADNLILVGPDWPSAHPNIQDNAVHGDRTGPLTDMRFSDCRCVHCCARKPSSAGDDPCSARQASHGFRGYGQDLDERVAGELGRCQHPHRVPRHPLRQRRVRGRAVLRDAEGLGVLPPRRPRRTPPDVGQDLPDGHAAHDRDPRKGRARHDPRQRFQGVLHPPDHLPRLRSARRQPAHLPRRRRHPDVGVGQVSGRRRAREGRRRQGELVAADGAQHVPVARQERRQLRQFQPDQDGSGGRRLRRGPRARFGRATSAKAAARTSSSSGTASSTRRR